MRAAKIQFCPFICEPRAEAADICQNTPQAGGVFGQSKREPRRGDCLPSFEARGLKDSGPFCRKCYGVIAERDEHGPCGGLWAGLQCS